LPVTGDIRVITSPRKLRLSSTRAAVKISCVTLAPMAQNKLLALASSRYLPLASHPGKERKRRIVGCLGDTDLCIGDGHLASASAMSGGARANPKAGRLRAKAVPRSRLAAQRENPRRLPDQHSYGVFKLLALLLEQDGFACAWYSARFLPAQRPIRKRRRHCGVNLPVQSFLEGFHSARQNLELGVEVHGD